MSYRCELCDEPAQYEITVVALDKKHLSYEVGRGCACDEHLPIVGNRIVKSSGKAQVQVFLKPVNI